MKSTLTENEMYNMCKKENNETRKSSKSEKSLHQVNTMKKRYMSENLNNCKQ